MFCANGEEQFHGSLQAAEHPLNAGLGLVATAESKTLVSSPGDGCRSMLKITYQSWLLWRAWGLRFAAEPGGGNSDHRGLCAAAGGCQKTRSMAPHWLWNLSLQLLRLVIVFNAPAELPLFPKLAMCCHPAERKIQLVESLSAFKSEAMDLALGVALCQGLCLLKWDLDVVRRLRFLDDSTRGWNGVAGAGVIW